MTIQASFHRALMFGVAGFLAMGAAPVHAIIRYVDPVSPGPVHNGTSWANAYTSLQTALAAAVAGDEIWVANGTYKPTAGIDRTVSFVIPNGVKLFGGFHGFGVNETSLAQRDIVSTKTILSGDIGAPGDNADNSYHVVVFGPGVTTLTRFDGFFITAGHANGGGSNNQGAGMRLTGSPIIRNCVFVGNVAVSSGGAVLTTGVSGFTNCVFSGNTASAGAAIDMQLGHTTLSNCTVANNTCTGTSSALRLLNGDGIGSVVLNSIVYHNTAAGGTLQNQQISATNAPLGVQYSSIQGSYVGLGNIDAAPHFADAAGGDNVFGTIDDDYELRGGFAGIDAGSNTFTSADLDDIDDDGITAETMPFDIAGELRRRECVINDTGSGTAPIVDMGAYEFKSSRRIICVNDTATGANNGTSWADAYTSLQDALFDAADVNDPDPEVIWVAQGTYKPVIPGGRAATFTVVSGTPMYGGFDDSGTNGSLAERNPHANRTILSGDIGIVGNNADNCYHVMTSNGALLVGEAPTIDGFIFTAGNCNGGGSDATGGGLRIFGNSPLHPSLRNCKFVGNAGTAATALDCLSTNTIIENCVFSGNSSAGFACIRLANPNAPWMINCTVANNSANGVSIDSSSGTTIVNCIIFGNGNHSQAAQVNTSGGGVVVVNYSCIEGLTGSLGGVGNIGAAPSFLDPDGDDDVFGTPDDDYRLLACSPGIDAGNGNQLLTDTEDIDDDGTLNERTPIDLAYQNRFANDPGVPNSGFGPFWVDMGAFEFQGNSSPLCPADCFPAGAPNGIVNIDDLVTVITQWGNCMMGNCAGDVFPPCKDQVINIDDLVSVITSWGNCP